MWGRLGSGGSPSRPSFCHILKDDTHTEATITSSSSNSTLTKFCKSSQGLVVYHSFARFFILVSLKNANFTQKEAATRASFTLHSRSRVLSRRDSEFFVRKDLCENREYSGGEGLCTALEQDLEFTLCTYETPKWKLFSVHKALDETDRSD